MYTADNIADFFLSKVDPQKGDTISPLKLQKLVYYAQAWHYTIFAEPLFKEKIEAWVNGPVTPSIYERFKGTAKHSNIDLAEYQINPPAFSANTLMLLNEVHSLYGEKTGSYLERLTHGETPWLKARGVLLPFAKSNSEITLESMKEYYSQFKNEA